ncbi:MAG TPA: metallophosphoesterase family protein [Methylomirabilota bacterium]|nr:metallophosphoesterase family protein [Methylomirabilota bacterium]
MRIAVLSDIHGNRTAFEAVVADLRVASPDLVLHGGDLAYGGADPAGIVDRIRELGWQGVIGNTDEMLPKPESLEEFARQTPKLEPLLAVMRELASVARETLGAERLAWLGDLPRVQIQGVMALVHASPQNLWRAPMPEATDSELASVYGPLRQPVAVYAHIHRPYTRAVSGITVANTGSVGLPHDGDPRAAYLLLNESKPGIRRVEYDVGKELKALAGSRLPHSGWIAKVIETGRFEMP